MTLGVHRYVACAQWPCNISTARCRAPSHRSLPLPCGTWQQEMTADNHRKTQWHSIIAKMDVICGIIDSKKKMLHISVCNFCSYLGEKKRKQHHAFGVQQLQEPHSTKYQVPRVASSWDKEKRVISLFLLCSPCWK